MSKSSDTFEADAGKLTKQLQGVMREVDMILRSTPRGPLQQEVRCMASLLEKARSRIDRLVRLNSKKAD